MKSCHFHCNSLRNHYLLVFVPLPAQLLLPTYQTTMCHAKLFAVRIVAFLPGIAYPALPVLVDPRHQQSLFLLNLGLNQMKMIKTDHEPAVVAHLLLVDSSKSVYRGPSHRKSYTSQASFYTPLFYIALTLADLAVVEELVDEYARLKVSPIMKRVLKIPNIYLDIPKLCNMSRSTYRDPFRPNDKLQQYTYIETNSIKNLNNYTLIVKG